MKRRVRNWRIWALTGMLLTAAVLVPVFAARQQGDLTATPYADVIRFEAGGAVESLQITIFDLSGRELWGSGVVSSRIIDWGRTNEWGERLAYGAYLYQAVGWDVDGSVVLERSGKLVLLPGDKVQLQAAPAVSDLAGQDKAPTVPEASPTVQPMGLSDIGIFGKVGIGTTSPGVQLDLVGNFEITPTGGSSSYKMTGRADTLDFQNINSGEPSNIEVYAADGDGSDDVGFNQWGVGTPADVWTNGECLWVAWEARNSRYKIQTYKLGTGTVRRLDLFTHGNDGQLSLATNGHVGIGTISPNATLEVHGTATNLLALYDPVVSTTDPMFKVDKTGNVYTDGTYYCSDGAVHVGSADVAERINTSEWVEPGNVVEIDPEHPGFFRKTRSPYSTSVAGVISTLPGVILGNSFDAQADKWEDNRPMLALAGRVLVKVTAENRPIQIGDLLVSSSTPGIGMKGSDREACVGAVIGKALEPLEKGTGAIMVQVMLR